MGGGSSRNASATVSQRPSKAPEVRQGNLTSPENENTESSLINLKPIWQAPGSPLASSSQKRTDLRLASSTGDGSKKKDKEKDKEKGKDKEKDKGKSGAVSSKYAASGSKSKAELEKEAEIAALEQERLSKPKSLSEGFWAPGWLQPGELGTPGFECWPDKVRPSDVHQAAAGRIVFGKKPPHLTPWGSKVSAPDTAPSGASDGNSNSNSNSNSNNSGLVQPSRFHSHEAISASAFLPCRLTRFCIGYQRPREMWRPLHHFCYLSPAQGAWVAMYLYIDGTAVCPARHALPPVPRRQASLVFNMGASFLNSPDHYDVESVGNSSDSDVDADADADVEIDADSENDDDDNDDDEDNSGNEAAARARGGADGGGAKAKERGIHTQVARTFHAAFHIYRLPPEEVAQTILLPIYLLPEPEAHPESSAKPGGVGGGVGSASASDAGNMTNIPARHRESCRHFARLLAAMPAGRHRVDIEMRVLFEDGHKALIGYHPASKTVADNFVSGPRFCLGPSEILARGGFVLNVHRRDRKSLTQIANQNIDIQV